MIRSSRNPRRGSAFLEFTLVAIPLIFSLISIAELGRGMWIYQTLAYAVKSGARYAVVHGQNCAAGSSSCAGTVQAVARAVQSAGVGLDAGKVNLTLQSGSSTQNCNPLNTCLSNTAQWPPYPDNSIGLPVTVSGTVPFQSAMAMFWPGHGGMSVAAVNFSAAAEEEIRY